MVIRNRIFLPNGLYLRDFYPYIMTVPDRFRSIVLGSPVRVRPGVPYP